MFYSSEPEELRAFIRDKLGFPCNDVGGGWLIFDLLEADMGCHPVEDKSVPSGTPHISFYCDDIEETVNEMKGRGVEFTSGIINEGYGLVTHFNAPGDFEMQLYQPLYNKITKEQLDRERPGRHPPFIRSGHHSDADRTPCHTRAGGYSRVVEIPFPERIPDVAP